VCTLALVRRPGSRYPLVVAANRDEAIDRPSTGPLVWDDPIPFVGGRDEVAGGTWLGLNAHGLVIGLTNHWTGRPPDPERASRGGIVRGLLQCRDLDEVGRALRARDPEDTNPFLLLAADRGGGASWTASADGMGLCPVTEPVFALGNESPENDPGHRARTLGTGLESELARAGDDPDRIRRLLAARLARHGGDHGPQRSVCVHTDRGYGTVSSSIFLLGHTPDDDRYWAASGPPCTVTHVDHTHLLEALRGQDTRT